jgi:hypothetical protein
MPDLADTMAHAILAVPIASSDPDRIFRLLLDAQNAAQRYLDATDYVCPDCSEDCRADGCLVL